MKNQQEVWDKLYKENKRLWSRESNFLPNILKDRRVLEIGVGNGKTLLSILKQKPAQVTAIDLSQNSINICKSLFKDRDITLIKDNICKTKIKSDSFDIIVCYFVLNNLKERERKNAINEMYRLLSDNGKILFEDFHVGDLRQKEGKSIKDEENTIIKNNNLIHHFFTKDELKRLFSKFRSINITEKSFSPFRNNKLIQRKIISAIIKK